MNDISKILDGLNIPKQLLEKAEILFGKLFGKGLDEIGLQIQDNIGYRRFKNQIERLAEAHELIEKHGFKAKEISLKTLVPLIEYSSLEEEPILQEKWSHLIASVSIKDEEDIFTNTYIEILNRLSSNEVKILDFLFDSYIQKREYEINRREENHYSNDKLEIKPEEVIFNYQEVYSSFKYSEEKFNYFLENIFTHGILRWGLPRIKNSTNSLVSEVFNNSNKYSLGNSVFRTNSNRLLPPSQFTFTYIGIGFIKACKFVQ